MTSSPAGFFEEILRPGSSLHPVFQLCVDVAFSLLLVVLVSCAFITNGNIHFIALSFVALALWGSIKWFIRELQNISPTKESQEIKKTS